MKKFILILCTLGLFSGAYAADQVTKTSFKVWGNCESCKKRIEKAVKVDGVKAAEWNDETKVMTIAFVPTKITLDQIEQNIAKVGYDTEKFKGDDAAYAKL